MPTSNALRELRRANPRSDPDFDRSLEATDDLANRIVRSSPVLPGDATRPRSPGRALGMRGRAPVRVGSAVLVAAAIVAAFVIVGRPGAGGIKSASAAVVQAAEATADSASSSGTATVAMTHDGEAWTHKTVQWDGTDLDVVDSSQGRQGNRELLVVDGVMYGQDPNGRWLTLGSPDSIDPGTGTTPDDYLAITHADVSGATLSQIVAGMTDLTTEQRDDGSTVYRGSVPAGLVATKDGFKEGESIRVFPFGYVAHDQAADPAALLDASITVGSDGLISELAVRWGEGGSAWTYTVTYTNLGSTGPIKAPDNAQPFPRRSP